MVKRDAEALRHYFTSDATYRRTPVCPRRSECRPSSKTWPDKMAMFPDSYEYRVVNLIGDGNVVLTERLDMVRGGDREPCTRYL